MNEVVKGLMILFILAGTALTSLFLLGSLADNVNEATDQAAMEVCSPKGYNDYFIRNSVLHCLELNNENEVIREGRFKDWR